jgi:serine protease AprX
MAVSSARGRIDEVGDIFTTTHGGTMRGHHVRCSEQRGRSWLAIAVAGASLAAFTGTANAAPEAAESRYLVSGSSAAAAERAVGAVGADVQQRLSVADAVVVDLSASQVTRLRQSGDVVAVTPDVALQPMDSAWGDDTTNEGKTSTLLAGSWVPQHDDGSMYSVAKSTGAHDVWGKSDPNNGKRKLTGAGVGIAVVDTGVVAVEGLKTTGKVLQGVDLSFESNDEASRQVDGYGHGTHMAAIAAGRDSAVAPGNEKDDKYFVGMAPDAQIVNVKVGSSDGGVDVSQVIAAVDWVVQHGRSKGVRVLSLSYGTDSAQSPALDPLAHAVETAWRAGVVVVAAAGNGGRDGATTLTMPAVDPWVIAVGSSDHVGTDKIEDDRVGAWTNAGTTARRPDLLAPGKSIVSLRVPGSYADIHHPEGLVHGDATGRMFRGTGTSQSTAVVAGAAALLLQRNPGLTPNQVKGLLRATAYKLPQETSLTQGAGRLDIKRAVELLEKGTPATYAQAHLVSLGTGSLHDSRGTSVTVDQETGSVLTGEVDAMGQPFDAAAWAPLSALGRSWSGGTWNGRSWSGDGWTSTGWAGRSWSGEDWAGRSWSGRSWSGRSWSGRSWSGDDWTGRSWSGRSWSGRSWSGRSWSGF